MRNLLIIGARGCGREVFDLFLECKESLKDVECKGFLDDKKDALDHYPGYPPIISSVEDYAIQPNDVFICALGEPKWKKHYAEIIERKGGHFISLISPFASIGKNTLLGDGCIVNRWSTLTTDITVGPHTYFGFYVCIGHDVSIGAYCHINAYTFMGGYVRVADGVNCHPRVNILPHKQIGENAILGASSVVLRNVPNDVSVFGIPAKKIIT